MCIACSPLSNHLIAGMPNDVRQRWLPCLERIDLSQGMALHESGRQMSYVYFPITAVVSISQETESGASMEIAVVGNEGFVGVELILGGGSMPNRAVVDVAGEAFRLPAWMLQEEVDRAGAAAQLLMRYTTALIAQVAQTAVCSRHHAVDQRLCRWLLMKLDRVQGREIFATHEQMAYALGVRRESVTKGSLHLQALGLIDCSRGRILVLDRKGLERQVCECYGVVKNEYDRLLPEALSTPRHWTHPTMSPDQKSAPNNAPTPAVIARASAPRKPTRLAPARTFAPATCAATAPNRARNLGDSPVAQAIAPRPGAHAATARKSRVLSSTENRPT